jgi:hypothetical protein
MVHVVETGFGDLADPIPFTQKYDDSLMMMTAVAPTQRIVATRVIEAVVGFKVIAMGEVPGPFGLTIVSLSVCWLRVQ